MRYATTVAALICPHMISSCSGRSPQIFGTRVDDLARRWMLSSTSRGCTGPKVAPARLGSKVTAILVMPIPVQCNLVENRASQFRRIAAEQLQRLGDVLSVGAFPLYHEQRVIGTFEECRIAGGGQNRRSVDDDEIIMMATLGEERCQARLDQVFHADWDIG